MPSAPTPGSAPRHDTAQIEEAIVLALKDDNMKAAASLLGLLAAVDPDRAQLILDGINLIAGNA